VPNLDLVGNNLGGAVDLFHPDGTIQVLTERGLGLIGADEGSFDRFGAAVVVTDLNGDEFPDLVVGAPGDRADGSTPGHVDLLLGSAGGITAAGATKLVSPARAGDEFGSAIAVSEKAIWIGAPGRDSGTVRNAGAVYRYQIGADGKATLRGSTTEATLGVPGRLQANERFGEVLAPAAGGVLVGVPNKDVGTARQAGQLVRLRLSSANAITAEVWSQNSPSVPGAAETGDHFGAALTESGYVVGVPGEDIGTLKDAGTVQAFRFGDLERTMVPGFAQSQNSAGIPGTAEAGDRYGAALAVGLFDCQEVFSVAVGAPGEDVGKATNAGSVTLSQTSSDGPACPARVLGQGRGLPGRPEAGDGVGTSVGVVNGDSDLEEDRFDTLLIGAPGEDVGTAPGGRNVGRATLRNHRGSPQAFGFQGRERQGLRYSAVFGS
jgi:hypothetical protein